MQKDIETKRTALITASEQLAEKTVTIEEQVNRELDEERTNRVIKYINAIDVEDFVVFKNKKDLQSIKKILKTTPKISRAIDSIQERTKSRMICGENEKKYPLQHSMMTIVITKLGKLRSWLV